MAGKKFRADAYLVYETAKDIDNDANPVAINLVQRIKEALGEDYAVYPNISRRESSFDPGRIQFMHQDEDGMIQIQFIRLREATPSEIAKGNGELEVLRLPEGDFLAESASAIFDPLSMVLIKQRSYFGASTAFVQTYLNSLLFDEAVGSLIVFAPLAENAIDLKYICRNTIKRFSAQVAYQGEALGMSNDMSQYKKYRPATVDIAVKAKRGKAGQLDKEEVEKQLRLLKNDSSTQKLSVTILDAEDRAQTIDLLTDHIVLDFSVANINRQHPATHQVIYPAMKNSYIKHVMNSDAPIFKKRKEWINEHRG